MKSIPPINRAKTTLFLGITCIGLLSACVAAPVGGSSALVAQQTFTQCPIRNTAGATNGPAQGSFKVNLIRNAKDWQTKTQDPTVALSDARDWRLGGANQLILVIETGSKPSAGFSVELVKAVPNLPKNRLEIQFKETLPAKEVMYASMVTTPCLMLHLNVDNSKKLSIANDKDHNIELAL
jgi:hypothetical protein